MPAALRLLCLLVAAPRSHVRAAIDRHAVVSRHNPSLGRVNTSEVAVLGNGAFALGIDVTGLQTLNRTFSGVPNASSPFRCMCPAHADVFFPLMTGSDWGWHSFKPPGKPGSKADPFAPPQYNSFWDRWRVSGNRSAMRESWYPTGQAARGTGGPRAVPADSDLRAAIAWRGLNPHRLSLGQIALRRVDGHGTTQAIGAEELSDINQTLDLWSGVAHSRFSLGGTAVAVDTAVHGDADLVSATVDSPLAAAGKLGVALSFGGGTGDKSGANWTIPDAHSSEIVAARTASNSVLIRRTLDFDSYLVRVSFADGAELRRVGPHAFIIAKPASASRGAGPSGPSPLWVSVAFAPEKPEDGIVRFLPPQLLNSSDDPVGSWLPQRWALAASLMGAAAPTPPVLPSFAAVADSSASHWRDYWSRGGMIDLSKTFSVDARAAELERRVVLSLYLTGAQEAGFVFTSESGLIQNSWVGKFHMEMKMWHTAHFALRVHGQFLELELRRF